MADDILKYVDNPQQAAPQQAAPQPGAKPGDDIMKYVDAPAAPAAPESTLGKIGDVLGGAAFGTAMGAINMPAGLLNAVMNPGQTFQDMGEQMRQQQVLSKLAPEPLDRYAHLVASRIPMLGPSLGEMYSRGTGDVRGDNQPTGPGPTAEVAGNIAGAQLTPELINGLMKIPGMTSVEAGNLVSKWGNKLSLLNPEQIKALKALPSDYPGITAAQATGSPMLNTLENITVPFRKAQILKAQQDYANRMGKPYVNAPDPDITIENASNLVKQHNPEVVLAYQNAVADGTLTHWLAEQNGAVRNANLADPQVAQMLLARGFGPDVTYKAIAAKALSSSDDVANFINATGDRKTMSDLASQKLGEIARDPVSKNFSPTKMFTEMTGTSDKADMYKMALGSKNYSNATRLMDSLAQVENAPNWSNSWMQYSFGMKMGRMALAVPATIAGGILAGHPGLGVGGAGLEGTLLLGEEALGKTLTNPTVARAMLEGTKMPTAAPASGLTSKIILQGLKGTSGLTLIQNNKMYPATIDEKGNLKIDQ